jgi:hypothetical protein
MFKNGFLKIATATESAVKSALPALAPQHNKSFGRKAMDLAKRHPKTTAALAVGGFGAGYMATRKKQDNIEEQ